MSESSFEIRRIAPVRQRGVGPVAHVLYHAGTCHFVSQGSDAEIDLLKRGAVHIGRLSFDAHKAPASSKNRLVEVTPEEASLSWGSNLN
jgi:hypothetical protein